MNAALFNEPPRRRKRENSGGRFRGRRANNIRRCAVEFIRIVERGLKEEALGLLACVFRGMVRAA